MKQNKKNLRRPIFIISTVLGIIIFLNRLPDFINLLSSPALKDLVIFDFTLRPFLEHTAFGFFFTFIVFVFFYGLGKFANIDEKWKWPYIIGVLFTLGISLWWEVFNAKGKIEFLEIGYDLFGLFLNWLYVKKYGDFR